MLETPAGYETASLKRTKIDCLNNKSILPPLSESIPREILECIFEYFTLKDIKSCASVSKAWKCCVWNFLKSVTLSGFSKDSTVEFISSHCPSLTHLDLSNCSGISDIGVESLAKVSGLKELKLKGCSSLTCEGFQNLRNLTRLELLQLPNMDDLESAFQIVSSFPKLKELDCSNCHQLKKVDVGFNSPALQRLDFRKCAQLVDIIGVLRLKNIRELSLQDCCQINDTHIVAISSCFPLLRYLDIQKCRVTDSGLKFVSQLSHLQFLNISKCHITHHGLDHLADLRDIQILYLDQIPNIGDNIFASLGKLPSLTQLYIWEAAGVTNYGMKCLSSLTNLECLDLYSCSGISDEGLQGISTMCKLRFLDLGYMRISNEGIRYLTTLTNLQHLCMPGCNLLTLEGFTKLSCLKLLQDNTLERCLHKVLKRGSNLKKPFVKSLL